MDMEIVSISLDKDTLKELNDIQYSLGFKSRSKMLRSTIDLLLNEHRIIDSLRGVHDVVAVITYRESEKNHVSGLLHGFEDAIGTTVHQHHSHLCLDMMNIDAGADVIRRLFRILKSSKCIKSVNFTILGRSEYR